MGALPKRKDIPPWVRVPEDLRDPEVFQVQTVLLEAMFGPGGSRIPYIEQVSRALLELKVLEPSNLTEVTVYGNYLYKLQTKWMLQSMAERHHLRQERGMLKLEDSHECPRARPLAEVKPVFNQRAWDQDVDSRLWPDLE